MWWTYFRTSSSPCFQGFLPIATPILERGISNRLAGPSSVPMSKKIGIYQEGFMSRTRISIFEDDGIATLHKDKTGIHRYILWEFPFRITFRHLPPGTIQPITSRYGLGWIRSPPVWDDLAQVVVSWPIQSGYHLSGANLPTAGMEGTIFGFQTDWKSSDIMRLTSDRSRRVPKQLVLVLTRIDVHFNCFNCFNHCS